MDKLNNVAFIALAQAFPSPDMPFTEKNQTSGYNFYQTAGSKDSLLNPSSKRSSEVNFNYVWENSPFYSMQGSRSLPDFKICDFLA